MSKKKKSKVVGSEPTAVQAAPDPSSAPTKSTARTAPAGNAAELSRQERKKKRKKQKENSEVAALHPCIVLVDMLHEIC